MKFLFFIFPLWGCFIFIYPQQLPDFSHFYANPFLYNPAAIGLTGSTTGYFHSRRQWIGIQGSPQTYLATIDGPVNNDKIAMGGMLFNDVTNIISKTGGYAAYRYAVNINKKHKLLLGLAGGLQQQRIYFDRIQSAETSDPGLFNYSLSGTAFDANMGICWKYEKLWVGISAMQLFNNRIYFFNQPAEKELHYQFIRHYNVFFTYRTNISSSVYFDPYLILRNVQGMPLQYEVLTNVNFAEKAWAGLRYIYKYGLGISAGTVFHEKYIIGYAFEMPTGLIRHFSGGTHEIVFGFKIGAGKQKYYNKIENSSDFNQLKSITQQQSEEIDKLRQENENLKLKIEQAKKTMAIQQTELKQLKEIYTHDNAILTNVISENRLTVKDIDTIDFKRNMLNKNETYSIILGAYLNFSDAKNFQHILRREFAVETNIFSREDGKYYFVYTKSFQHNPDTKNAIRNEFKRLNKIPMHEYLNGNPWIYRSK